MSRLHPKPVRPFEPRRYPKVYHIRMEGGPWRRRGGLLLVLLGFLSMGLGVVQSGTEVLAGGCALLLIGCWLAMVRQHSLMLCHDRIEVRHGKDGELRYRQDLLGWKFAVESPEGLQAGKPCWILLVAADDDVLPLMLQINQPEFDDDFRDWVFSLPDLMTINAMGSPAERVELPAGDELPQAEPGPIHPE